MFVNAGRRLKNYGQPIADFPPEWTAVARGVNLAVWVWSWVELTAAALTLHATPVALVGATRYILPATLHKALISTVAVKKVQPSRDTVLVVRPV